MGKKNYNLKERDLQKEGLLITEGALLFERLLASGLPIENIWCSEAVYGKYHREDLPFTVLSREELSRVAGYSFHRGVLALARAPEILPLDRIDTTEDRGILVLPRLGDPENLGGLLRTALGLGMQSVILGPGNPYPFGRKALRSAMGAQFKLNLYRFDSAEELFEWNGGDRQIIASALNRDATGLETFSPAEKWLLLMGHEGQGLEPSYLDRADVKVMIPQSPGVDSLNVNVAAGILLYRLGMASSTST